jgi:hypothetical protein
MAKEKEYCKPCAEIAREKYTLTPIATGVNRKITCEMCQRRRYGARYELKRKRNEVTP